MNELVQEGGYTVQNVFPDSQKEKDRQNFVCKVGKALEKFRQEDERKDTQHLD